MNHDWTVKLQLLERLIPTRSGEPRPFSLAPLIKATVYTQVESELVSIRAEWTQTVAARVLK